MLFLFPVFVPESAPLTYNSLENNVAPRSYSR
jgi:hypothetical protein